MICIGGFDFIIFLIDLEMDRGKVVVVLSIVTFLLYFGVEKEENISGY